MGFRRIIKNFKIDGFDGFFYRLLKKLNFKIKYLNIIEKNKYNLDQRILKITNNQIISGLYKGTYLVGKNHWGAHDFSSKMLGLYEEQVQKKILDIKERHNLEYLVNFGASDGFHVLGLIKNKIFKKGFAFEINPAERIILKKNIEKNNLCEKIEIFEKANFEEIFNILDSKKLEKSLFLIDIEGGEFDLFRPEYIKKLERSFFIIENHDFLLRDIKKKRDLDNLLKNYFDIELIKNSGRNPFAFDFIKDLSDDERWLIMSEGRPCEMNWIVLRPKKDITLK